MSIDGLLPVPGVAEVARILTPPAAFPAEVVQVRIAEATALAQRFTRGAGFSPDRQHVHPDLAVAIAASAARSLLNPSLPLALAGPPLSSQPGSFATWTNLELGLLNRLRNLEGVP